jgi:hypothetical protein
MFGCQRLSRRLARACLGLTFLLTGCGGGGGDAGTAPVTPPVVVTPKAAASFTAPASAAANQAVVFDAGASTSSDGSALSYYWDFGNGQHGGGKTIARSFATGGARSVTLTVVDGASLRDTQTKTLTIAAPVAGASVMANGRITGLDGVAIEGVAVAQAAFGSAAPSVSTDAMGKVAISLASNVPLALKLSKTGFADQFVSLTIPTGTGADAYFEAVLRPRDAALTLADATAGGTLAGRDGASITLPANALVNGAGTAADGAVQIAMTPVDVTAPGAGGFPGSFDGIKADGTTTPIVSFGTVEFVLSSGVDRLQLAAGKTATIEVPIYGAMRPDSTVLAIGDTTPLWSLDETTSTWIQEGTGTVVASAASPSGLAMRATVSHLSWWNSDLGFDPYGPRPRCVFDTDSGNPGGLDTFATATVCNLLAEFDRGPGNGLSLRARALASTQAAPLSNRVTGYRRAALVPIAGGTTIPVPANVGIALSANMLNGSWIGSTVVNGPVGVQEEVLVKMHQIATTGSVPEAITVPFDAVRSLITGQTALYTFSGVAAQYARITVGDGTGSNLSGRVRLLQGTTALGSANFGPGTAIVVAALPVDGSYTVELTGTANTPGVYHLQVELLGGLQIESLGFPFDATKTLPDFVSYRGNFNVSAAGTVYFEFLNQRGVPAQLRLIGPGGAVVFSATGAGPGTTPVTIALPTAGAFSYEVAWQDGQGGMFELTGEPTPWVSVAPGLDVGSFFSTIDLVADRNGKPVVGYVTTQVVNQQTQTSFALRRWNGTAWENAASDLTPTAACSGIPIAGFAFDSGNNLLIAYGSTSPTGSTFTTVRKFVAGAWQPVGPDDGTLPIASPFSSSCQDRPAITLDAADRPMVAYRSGNAVTVQRFDGTAWQGLATASGDSFDSIQGGFDLRLDSGDQPYLAIASAGVVTVRRFNPTPGVGWEAVGSSGGVLPSVNTVRLDTPQIRFSATGRPAIASVAGIPFPGSPGVSSAGVVVHRFDGVAWSTTGGYQTSVNNYLINTPTPGFTLSNGAALVSWSNATRNDTSAPVVDANTAAGWVPVGAGFGEIPQYTRHGATPDASGLDSRLVQIGAEVYLSIIVSPPPTGVATPVGKVTLLRKVGN